MDQSKEVFKRGDGKTRERKGSEGFGKHGVGWGGEDQGIRANFLKQKAPARAKPGQGPNGGWEFAKLSFPGRHLAPYLGMAAGFPTLFSTASGVFGLVAGPSSTLRLLNFEW